ncbi:MAG: alpha/beta fold hydrolase [Lewinellaceae bacterium]|nr:alpha/beta fold hydrolase [Lewinellaceae bacterium]
MLELSGPLSAYVQKRLIFRPTTLPEDYQYRFDTKFEELFFDTPDGARLNALFFPQQQESGRGVVLYFHGNRDNLQRWGQFQEDFTRLGFDFVAPDYRSYGKSTGQPSERVCYEDARLVYDWLREQYPADRIVLYGRSLGAAMASYLGAHVRAKTLVLETPFDNIRGLFASYLNRLDVPFKPAFHFPNDRHVRQSTLPILIFHGKRDRVVPFASAQKLAEYLKPGDRFVTIPEGSHTNLRNFDAYHENLSQWLQHSPGI